MMQEKSDAQLLPELLQGAELVKSDGNVIFIKLDGARTTGWYTVIITFVVGGREMIRSDKDTLEEALADVLGRYFAT